MIAALLAVRARKLGAGVVVALAAAALTAPAAHADHSVFERVSAGAINGNGAFDAGFRGASADGTDVFFHTPERLVSGDTDGDNDVYAARVP